MQDITLQEIENAYLKLKSSIYYETSNTLIPLRLRLSEFENKTDKKKVFEEILDKLSDLSLVPTYIENLFKKDEKKYFVIPKKIKSDSNLKNKNVITNNRVNKSIEIEKVNIMINASIEVHIISVLWILKLGFKIDAELIENCFGNRLVLTKNKKNVASGRGLFKPYIKQYQRWRDDGVKIAKKQLESGIDVAFVNLDVAQYYYRIEFDWNDLPLKPLENSMNFNLDYALNLIHKLYSNILFKDFKELYNFHNRAKENYEEIDKVLLPIGLLSSPILANYHLTKFDEQVASKLRPTYFARYVDDILIVISRPFLEYSKSEDEPESIKFIRENLSAILSVKNEIELNVKSNVLNETIFNIEGYNDLYIQNDKVMLYKFKADQSLAVIEKLKKDIEQKSSEFRFLATEDESSFDSDAYELLYDDSFGKPRTLKDYKENRYGVPAYLSKKINSSLRVQKHNVKYETKKILAFFNGRNSIEYFQQWERVFTYLLINNKFDEIFEFFQCVIGEIDKIKCSYNTILGKELKLDLYNYFVLSLSLAIALNPSAIKSLRRYFSRIVPPDFFKGNLEENLEENLLRYSKEFRVANMIRHYCVTHSLFNYCRFNDYKSKNDDFLPSLIDPSIDWDNISVSDLEITNQESPRRVKFYEACILNFYQRIKNNEINLEDSFLKSSYELYKKINKEESLPEIEEIYKAKKNSEDVNSDKTNPIIIEIQCGFDKKVAQNLNVAIANIKVDWDKHAYKSLRGEPVLTSDRQNKLIKLLNKFEKEQPESGLLMLPENSVPHDWLSYISLFCVPRQKGMIFGMEHLKNNGDCYNFVVTILPIELNGIKDAMVIPRLKNHYSHEESHIITNYFMTPMESKFKHYNLFHWNDLYFTVFYCFEFADIEHRAAFRSKVDMIVIPEFNKDVNYFSNLVESSTRDLGCFIVQVNSSTFGDSRITQPTKTDRKDILKIKGGKNDVVLISSIDINSYREYQEMKYGLQKEQKDVKPWKPTPPNFDIENVKKRIKNLPILGRN